VQQLDIHIRARAHRYPVGLLWTSDQFFARAATYTTNNKQQTQEPNNQAAADLRLRTQGHRKQHLLGILCNIRYSILGILCNIRYSISGILCNIRYSVLGILCNIRYSILGILCNIRYSILGILCNIRYSVLEAFSRYLTVSRLVHKNYNDGLSRGGTFGEYKLYLAGEFNQHL
jgi:hypothetical protein